MKRGLKFATIALLLVVMLVVMPGCKGKKQIAIDPSTTAGPSTGTAIEPSSGDGLPEIDINNIAWTKWAELQPVYFDYDSYVLRPDALAALQQNADIIKAAPGEYVQVEGHCDERGTQEYNFALGEKRALAVREHLMRLGVSGDRIVTVSYGEEMPAVPGSGEAAWSKNRRCEFNRPVR